ncbi:MAG: hypothetical protein BWZ02_03347 [Lentisphaerae bacterium ADurb.BinA184]|nr:MAG: hypothetical protein BWZ02_03347 [Lentisphaerae bacterium ADurb.BinA184]
MTIPDTFKVVYEGKVIANTGSVSGSGTLTAKGTGSSPRVTIRVVSSDDQGTAWNWSATATFFTEDEEKTPAGGGGKGGGGAAPAGSKGGGGTGGGTAAPKP